MGWGLRLRRMDTASVASNPAMTSRQRYLQRAVASNGLFQFVTGPCSAAGTFFAIGLPARFRLKHMTDHSSDDELPMAEILRRIREQYAADDIPQDQEPVGTLH